MFDDAERRRFQHVEGHACTDVFVVLVATLKVLHVGRQVRVNEAEAGVVENKPHGHTTFVPLQDSHTECSTSSTYSQGCIHSGGSLISPGLACSFIISTVGICFIPTYDQTEVNTQFSF